jgi:hypothetical protein
MDADSEPAARKTETLQNKVFLTGTHRIPYKTRGF